MTVGFHFRYIMSGEYYKSDKVDFVLLKRVLRVIQPNLVETGTVLIRIGKLVYTQDLNGPQGAALRTAFARSPKRCFSRGQQRELTEGTIPLDRIFVVTLSGRLGGFQKPWSQSLRRHVRHPFLFSLEVDVADRGVEWIYLRQNTAIGELSADNRITLDFEALELDEHLPKLLNQLGLVGEFGRPALRKLLTLIEKPLQPPT